MRRVLAGRACGLMSAGRTILAAVVVEIVLAVMLFAVDMAALHILSMLDPVLLAARHLAVGGSPRFHAIDMGLAALQTSGFTRGQAAGGFALLNAALLIQFALLHARGLGLGKERNGQNGGQQQGAGFHDGSPVVCECSDAITR